MQEQTLVLLVKSKQGPHKNIRHNMLIILEVVVDKESNVTGYGLEIGVFRGDPQTTALPKWLVGRHERMTWRLYEIV